MYSRSSLDISIIGTFLSIIALDDGVQWGIELVCGLEEYELDDEEILDDLAPELSHQFPRGLRGSPCVKYAKSVSLTV